MMLKLIERVAPVEQENPPKSRIAEVIDELAPVLKRNKKFLIAAGLAAVAIPLVLGARKKK